MTASGGFTGEVFLEDLAGLDQAGFIVCAYFTPGDGYEHYARRLFESCRRMGLAASIWRAPVVHFSISRRGTDDLRFTKPSFIRFCLERFGRAIAYLDVDMMVAARPRSLYEALEQGCDFAIYNWLADPGNESYMPANDKLASPEPESAFYLFSHRVDWCSEEQLNCSGATQLYADSPAARALLAAWQQVIAANPRAPDDLCLNFAYNNPPDAAPPPRSAWLAKGYARYPWWPQAQPVILHPAMPSKFPPFDPVREDEGHRVIHFDRCRRNETEPLFPRDGGVDTRTGIVFRLDPQGRPQPVGHYGGRFWIYPEDPPLDEVIRSVAAAPG